MNMEIRKLKNLTAKEYFASLISIVVLADLAILLNIPLLRQILGFFCFMIIPGLLILHILRLDKIEFLKKIVLSIGLSITFLMLGGLFVNCFHPFISSPLSLHPLLVSFNIFLVILAAIAYERNKLDFSIKNFFNFKLDLKEKSVSILLFPVLFPFMSIFGEYLLNFYGTNTILVAMLLLIPVYVVVITTSLQDRISKNTYPIAILMIAVALALMYGLRHNNIPVGDICYEYYAFKLTRDNAYWDISNFQTHLNAMLSVTILPTIYSLFLGLSGQAVYLIVYRIIYAVTPLIAYALFRNYINDHFAFLAAFFIVSQFPYMTLIGSTARVEIAYVLFFSAILVFFDKEIDESNRRALFSIFVMGMILSHYSTTFIFLLFAFLHYLITVLFGSKLETKSKIIGNEIALFSVFTFFWYSQITIAPFNSAVNFIKEATVNLAVLSMESLKSQGVFLGGIQQSLPHKVTVIIHDISFAVIGIGVIRMLLNYKSNQFDESYLLFMFMSLGLLILVLFLGSVYRGYGSERVFHQLLIFTAPAFIVGCKTISSIASKVTSKLNSKKLNLGMFIVLSLIVLQFFGGTYMVYQIGGIHYAEYLNTDGVRYSKFYVHDQDIAGGKWLSSYKDQNIQVWSDYYGRHLYAQFDPLNTREGISYRSEVDGYIYLRYENVVNGKIDPHYTKKKSIEDISHLFMRKDKIYTNGGSEVYI